MTMLLNVPRRSLKPRHSSMVWTRLAALAVSAIVAIPAYGYVSTKFDSDMLGLVAVSLLLLPMFGLMRCMLDPCER